MQILPSPEKGKRKLYFKCIVLRTVISTTKLGRKEGNIQNWRMFGPVCSCEKEILPLRCVIEFSENLLICIHGYRLDGRNTNCNQQKLINEYSFGSMIFI
mmetsp:Transcript_22735/g.36905  ORF Transcript_22735/g.36905 Transcript_22735/m.36905 type:complete len:100 (+) Transcript_22735:410-709(+)